MAYLLDIIIISRPHPCYYNNMVNLFRRPKIVFPLSFATILILLDKKEVKSKREDNTISNVRIGLSIGYFSCNSRIVFLELRKEK